MFFHIADIEAPSFMTSSGLEGVQLRLMRLPWLRLDRVEPTILGHDAATGSWRHGNAKLLEGGEHSPLPK
jgi:hypothetical protein